MIPLRDNIRPRRFPAVNYALIALTSLVFALQAASDPEGTLAERYGMIPARVVDPESPVRLVIEAPDAFGRPRRVLHEPAPSAVPPWLTLLTCIVLHGGWLHFLGNMWFLHIFGDNVEDRLGHLGYLAFYAGTGVAASAVHLATDPSSPVPTIGASGAIAGVMGAYFLLYPHARVLTLIPIFIFIEILSLPAFFFLAIWFAFQFFQGTLSLGSGLSGGVAWWAHIGGFAAGALVALALRRSGSLERRRVVVLPQTDSTYRYYHYDPWHRR
jgi:hypothetical protein